MAKFAIFELKNRADRIAINPDYVQSVHPLYEDTTRIFMASMFREEEQEDGTVLFADRFFDVKGDFEDVIAKL